MNGAPYGYCPHCGATGIARERLIGGNDRCANGHGYPSLMAMEAGAVRPALPTKPAGAPMNPILNEINDERRSQILKGYTEEHDDEHTMGEIAAVAAYIAAPTDDERAMVHAPPWAEYILNKWRNNRRKQLLIAAALLVAEIQRLDRIEALRV